MCLLLEYLLYCCVLAESKCLFGNEIVFSWILIHGFRFVQKLWRKNFFAALALSALRRLRFQSDLLDGTAFEVLSLVVCTKGPMTKKV